MSLLKKLILPYGKRNPLYVNYLKWSFISHLFTSTQAVLATNNIIYTINCESELLISTNYIGKDLLCQIGGLMVLSKVGNESDKNAKKFLLYSNIIQQSSFFSMALIPIFPKYFLPITGPMNILSNLSSIGFGAVNAKCISKLANNNNIMELYSKITIVNAIGSSIGLFLGITLNILIPDDMERSILIPILGFLKIYTFSKAIKNLL